MKAIASLLTALAILPASAAVIQIDLFGNAGEGLLPGNENPTVSGGSGGEIGGGITYNDATNQLSINVGWGSGNGFSDLAAGVSGAHIHGATSGSGTAAFSQNAGVIFSLSPNTSPSSGFINQTVTLSEAQEAQLLDGRFYINIHTSANPGGEIRGNLVQAVPEPTIAALSALGLLSLVRRRR